MTSLEYHRPQTLEEALTLLEQGVPLAGGTRITPALRNIPSVVDLQDLGLDHIEIVNGTVTIGGTATLQGLVENAEHLPEALVQTARLEAGWNIRNKATVSGTVVTGDGRSPLLTVLLATETELEFAPGDERSPLEEVLARGANRAGGKLITAIHLRMPERLRYAQVARSPMDRPQVCVAAGKSGDGIRVALGGFGEAPQPLERSEELVQVAREAYAQAGDWWASAEYRADAAGTLVARLVRELGEE